MPKFTLDPSRLPPWVMEELVSLASQAPFGDGRVQLGFAFDGLYLPKEVLVPLFQKVREVGVKLITLHYVNGGIWSE